ncbi:hypothetical protein F5X99DRAFT_125668 [Biscogniauxia marginata]|nr:hypothetical protein F5X99DRAFT_125668 [Biscogniauxia marginata]
MPSPVVQNPPVQAESKSAKKKKAKSEQIDSPAPASENPASVAGHDGQDDASESPYVRDLQKHIRNLNKKITNASKTDSLVDQHKGKSLEELVDAKIINPDQKAQRLKKPHLEAQLAQAEEQLAQYKKIEDEYRTRAAAEKATLEKSLTERLEKEKADAVADVQEKAAAEAKQAQHDNLLVLSQFLRLAAARRSEEADSTLDENMALEGVLLSVYSGDEHAVATMLKLIEGSDEKTNSVNGDQLETSFGQIKAAAMAHISPFIAAEGAPENEVPVETTEVDTDPTIAHAGLTEIDSTGATPHLTNGHTEPEPTSVAGIPNADVSDNAANAAGESQWDTNNDLSASVNHEDWVEVPRNPTETDTGLTATPETPVNVQSWADDQPEHLPEHQPEHQPEQPPAPTESGDGFRQVQRNRPRGHERESSWRGRGRGDYRGGRGGFGEGRGRGRGRGRGGMGMRGRPRNEQS